MEGRQKPDTQPDNDKAIADEEIIELTQVVKGNDNDEIIDLTDIMEQPDQALNPEADTDETVIDSIQDTTHPDLTVALEYKIPSGHTATEAKIAKIEAQNVQIREEMRAIVVDLQAGLRGLYVQIRDMEKILGGITAD